VAIPATAPRPVTTRRLPQDAGPSGLLDLLPDEPGVLSWLRHGEGLVGWGEVARFEPTGARRFSDAENWWTELTADLDVHDEVVLPGTGPVAFVSLAFADQPGHSVLVVPRVVVGRRAGVTWITEFGDGPVTRVPQARRSPGELRYSSGQLGITGYRSAVAEAVRRIRAGELHKVVLAHDLIATADRPIDPRFVLHGLAARYPSCWVYAVDGLVGATPELLLRRRGGDIFARLLAGTVWPDGESDPDRLANALLSSPKNRVEHRYGIESLAESLRPYCAELAVPDEPSVLRLHNVAHLASDVHGRVGEHTSLLRLTEAIHPTGAVGGWPRDAAVRAIAELEGMDRGRYAGPVGWIDAAGDGEFGVALRCALLRGHSARLFAGCGIVAGSDPQTEATEAAAKFVPVRDALEGA